MINRLLLVVLVAFLLFMQCGEPALSDVTVPAGSVSSYNHQDLNRTNIYKVRNIYLGDATSNTMRIAAPELANDNYDFVFPNADGTANQCLATDGNEVLSWIDVLRPTATQTVSNKTHASPIITTAAMFNAQAELRLGDSDSSNYVGFKSPATVGANKVWTLPDADGSENQVLVTDGNGVLGWGSSATVPSSGAVYSDGDALLSEAALDETRGGTAQTTYTTGDTLYASGANTLAKLGAGSNNAIYYMASGVPAWSSTSALQFDGTNVGIGGAPSFSSGSGLHISRATIATLKLSRTNATAVDFSLRANNGQADVATTTSTQMVFSTNNTARMILAATAPTLTIGAPSGTTGDRLGVKASGSTSTAISVEDDNSTGQRVLIGNTSGSGLITLNDDSGNSDVVLSAESFSTFVNGIRLGSTSTTLNAHDETTVNSGLTWTNVSANPGTYAFQLNKIGTTIQMSYKFTSVTTSGTGAIVAPGAVPAGYRPAADVWFIGWLSGTGSTQPNLIKIIASNGNIEFTANGGGTSFGSGVTAFTPNAGAVFNTITWQTR